MSTPYETTHSITFMQAHTIADALIAYALQTDSTDDRIRNVIGCLRAIEYGVTANVLERLQGDLPTAVERIEEYSSRVDDDWPTLAS